MTPAFEAATVAIAHELRAQRPSVGDVLCVGFWEEKEYRGKRTDIKDPPPNMIDGLREQDVAASAVSDCAEAARALRAGQVPLYVAFLPWRARAGKDRAFVRSDVAPIADKLDVWPGSAGCRAYVSQWLKRQDHAWIPDSTRIVVVCL